MDEIGGASSFLGEIWYTEADKPEGPWKTARKIVTHDHYSFYNPVHIDFYDQAGGRIIYFEGTYTTTFSSNNEPTPRYDYNQIMYRLDLADPRLKLSAIDLRNRHNPRLSENRTIRLWPARAPSSDDCEQGR